MAEHTKGLLEALPTVAIAGGFKLLTDQGDVLATIPPYLEASEVEANAMRLRDCWNSLAGITDPSAVGELVKAAEAARIELLYLAEQTGWREGGSCDKALEKLTDALSRLKGE